MLQNRSSPRFFLRRRSDLSRKEFFIDLDECTGCNLCIIACKDEHVGSEHLPWTKSQPDSGHFWMNLKTFERGQVPKVKVTYLPLLCQHCDNAPCMKVCPEDAIYKGRNGLVQIDQKKCTGCGLCQEACPYDVIYMNEEQNVAQKCTGCAHLVELGEEPRCADICPRDAIFFGDEDDPRLIELKKKAGVFHPEFEAEPRVWYKGLPKPFLAGTVIDTRTDDVISGVQVNAMDLYNDEQLEAVSDDFGDFWLRDLSKGHKYRIEFKKDGFKILNIVAEADEDRNLGEITLIPI